MRAGVRFSCTSGSLWYVDCWVAVGKRGLWRICFMQPLKFGFCGREQGFVLLDATVCVAYVGVCCYA